VALFAVMLLAWAGLPIAGQAALLAAGVLAGDGDLAIEWVLVSATLASAAGGAVGYWIGFHSSGTFDPSEGHCAPCGRPSSLAAQSSSSATSHSQCSSRRHGSPASTT
jgi:hypothetical protein